jgi:hypothetical protein
MDSAKIEGSKSREYLLLPLYLLLFILRFWVVLLLGIRYAISYTEVTVFRKWSLGRWLPGGIQTRRAFLGAEFDDGRNRTSSGWWVCFMIMSMTNFLTDIRGSNGCGR